MQGPCDRGQRSLQVPVEFQAFSILARHLGIRLERAALFGHERPRRPLVRPEPGRHPREHGGPRRRAVTQAGHRDGDAEHVGFDLGPALTLGATAHRAHRREVPEDLLQAPDVVPEAQGGPFVDREREVGGVHVEVEANTAPRAAASQVGVRSPASAGTIKSLPGRSRILSETFRSNSAGFSKPVSLMPQSVTAPAVTIAARIRSPSPTPWRVWIMPGTRVRLSAAVMTTVEKPVISTSPSPALKMPASRAAPTASIPPWTTGVPSGNPVTPAAARETPPATSIAGRASGSNSSGTRSGSEGSKFPSQPWNSPAVVSSKENSPVSRPTIKPLAHSTEWAFSVSSGLLRASHSSLAVPKYGSGGLRVGRVAAASSLASSPARRSIQVSAAPSGSTSLSTQTRVGAWQVTATPLTGSPPTTSGSASVAAFHHALASCSAPRPARRVG